MSRRGLPLACLLTLLAALLAPSTGLAEDVIHKTDGSRVRGRITAEDTRNVTIETLGGTFVVPRAQIARVERDGDVFRDFAARRGRLTQHDKDGWADLGRWCQDQGLYAEAIDCFHEVLRIDPDHEDARWELGYRRGPGGRWVTEAEHYEARGYRRWQDRWVTADECEKLEQGLVLVDGHWVPREEAEAAAAARADAAPRGERREPARGGDAAADDHAAGRERRNPGYPWGAGPIGPQPGPQAPLSQDERQASLERRKREGGWSVAVASRYYDFFSNGPLADVQRHAFVMDLMCEEYRRIFQFEQELARPFPVWLYADQREFMARTGMGPGTGGFYDGQKIVGFHGSLGSLDTDAVLFHEGTHQFQGLVLGENMWRAKVWLIEGLAVFFEASEVEGRRLSTGAIPRDRLAHVKRAIQTNSNVPLRDLIRLDQAQFGALHYAHAWSLIYFLVHGTNGGRRRFVEYWNRTRQGGEDPVRLFEELFDRPMDQLEAAWKQYVLRLA